VLAPLLQMAREEPHTLGAAWHCVLLPANATQAAVASLSVYMPFGWQS
jgi:hypothetical protein